MDGGESTGALHELDEFVIVACDPLAAKWTSQGRAERKGLAGSVHIQDGDTR
jgi:hypothetical protein